MNLLPLGQATAASDEQAFFFEEPIVAAGEDMVMTTSLDEGDQPSFLTSPVYFLHRSYSDTKSRWEMLTGLSFESSTPNVIADAFKRVVQKNVDKPGAQREKFGDWKGYKIAPPTPSELSKLEQLAQSNQANIEVGTIVEGTNPANSQEQMMHVDYFVTVDPFQLNPEIASGGFSNRTKTAGIAGLVVGGIATSLLVRKGVGLKLLAGFAGGVITAGIFMSAIQATDREIV